MPFRNKSGINITHTQYTRAVRDIFTGNIVGITRSVIILMMVENSLSQLIIPYLLLTQQLISENADKISGSIVESKCIPGDRSVRNAADILCS